MIAMVAEWTRDTGVLMGVPYIIDIEASGFGRGSYPIEVGIAKPDGSVCAYLIRPEPDWQHWDEGAAQVHGITRHELEQYGLPVKEVARQLNEQLRGQVVYSDSWGFDSSWLSLLFHYAGIIQAFRVDTLSKLLTEEQAIAWGRVKQQVMTELGIVRHRAGPDARMLQCTYLQTSDG